MFVGPSLSRRCTGIGGGGIRRVADEVAVPEMALFGRAYAAGVRTATAPLVAFTEDHCYPEPEWAEAFSAGMPPANGPAWADGHQRQPCLNGQLGAVHNRVWSV